MSFSLRDLARQPTSRQRGKLRYVARFVGRALGFEAPAPAPRVPPPARLPPRQARFTEHAFNFGGERHAYRLFVPSRPAEAVSEPLPLVVLLHGCKQDAADFAKGTGMNALAQAHRCMVLYPQQSAKANGMRCWNWFEKAHQTRDAGEPAMIANLTRSVLSTRNGDPSRVYIAGLSAGGAMAALAAGLYLELFAAAGVHSGLPAGAAGDVMSAFSAMRRGASGSATAEAGAAVPTIVFHGSDDTTVHPVNGDHVVAAALAGHGAAGLELVSSETPHHEGGDEGSDSRRAQRVRYSAPDGTTHVEHWTVDSGPHAWSGGDAAGSFTDPEGPGASAAMLSFFLQHRRD